MSCSRIENRILPYIDGRLKAPELRAVEAHLSACPACRLRVNEFRAVSGLIDELPQIEPSEDFDARLRARVTAEPAKRSWWAFAVPSPRPAVAAAMLLMASVWIGLQPPSPVNNTNSKVDETQINEDLPVLENFDVLSSFAPLTELPPPVQGENAIPATANQQM
jgi:anti-sigma factor RsiW